MVDLLIASGDDEFEAGIELVKEYAENLGLGMCFDGLDEELESFEELYTEPEGTLILGYENDLLIGCVALREIDRETVEMKRLYVKPLLRGRGHGRSLAEEAVESAESRGYKVIKLHTHSSLRAAQSLYESIGFYKVDPPKPKGRKKKSDPEPDPNIIYMEMEM